MSMLAIDIGNTNIHFAIFSQLVCKHSWQQSSTATYTTADFNSMLQQHMASIADIQQIVISSVVPHHHQALTLACQQYVGTKPIFAGKALLSRWMHISYDATATLGADRIVNAFAARQKFSTPLMVVDAGTAITFDLINKEGHYQAGPILPGIEMSFQALCRHAAQLKNIPFGMEKKVIVSNTTQAMQSGCYWATVESISGIIARIQQQEGFQHASVIVTGGSMRMLTKDIHAKVFYEPQLNLQGLAYIAQQNL